MSTIVINNNRVQLPQDRSTTITLRDGTVLELESAVAVAPAPQPQPDQIRRPRHPRSTRVQVMAEMARVVDAVRRAGRMGVTFGGIIRSVGASSDDLREYMRVKMMVRRMVLEGRLVTTGSAKRWTYHVALGERA